MGAVSPQHCCVTIKKIEIVRKAVLPLTVSHMRKDFKSLKGIFILKIDLIIYKKQSKNPLVDLCLVVFWALLFLTARSGLSSVKWALPTLKPGSETLMNTIFGFQIHLFATTLSHCENAYNVKI